MNKQLIKKVYQTYRLFIFPAVVIVSCLILIAFIILPQAVALINNFQSENQLQSKFKVMEAKAQVLEGVDSTDLNRKLELALNVYPSDNDFASVVGMLQEVVGRYGFTVISMQVGKSTQQKQSPVPSFGIKLDLLGTKDLLNDLIDGIENFPRIMKVSSIELTTVNTGNATVGLEVEAYYQTLPKDFGSVDSPLPALSDKEEAILSTLARVSSKNFPTGSAPRGKPNPFE